jgi:hypothetical protein
MKLKNCQLCKSCSQCGGQGVIGSEPCPRCMNCFECNGDGVTESAKELVKELQKLGLSETESRIIAGVE